MLEIGSTLGYRLLHAGELVSYLDGPRSRKITVESIRNYIARQLAADRGKFQHHLLPPKPNTKNAKGATSSTRKRRNVTP
jgi:hypothetical protein